MKERVVLSIMWSCVALVIALTSATLQARGASVLQEIQYVPEQQNVLNCPYDSTQNAGFVCEIVLARGERVNDGLNAEVPDWDPHVTYDGDVRAGAAALRPHFAVRPSRLGLRTNVILTTTEQRTYRILLISVPGTEPAYYAYGYRAEERARAVASMHELALRAVATQAALRAELLARPPLSLLADLSTHCLPNSDYRFDTNAKGMDPKFLPQRVCNDTAHTYVQFPSAAVAPVDVPVLHAITDEGDTLLNAPFDPARSRYTTDGVYDELVLVSGSQRHPKRLVLYRYAPPQKRGRR